MSKTNPTFEEVNAHIESSDLTKLAKQSSATALTVNSGQICSAYAIIRPILLLLASFPFIPDKWKKALKVFMQFMDVFCPIN
jgi:hypothetical protein